MISKKMVFVKKNLPLGHGFDINEAVKSVRWTMVDIVMIEGIKAKLEFNSTEHQLLRLFDETGTMTTEIFGGILNGKAIIGWKSFHPRTDLGVFEYEFEEYEKLMTPEEKEELLQALLDGVPSE